MAVELLEPRIVVRGPVSSDVVEYGRAKLRAIAAATKRPILGVELRLTQDRDPARAQPCHAEAFVDVDGALVRAHAAAPTTREAVDATKGRLERRLDATLARARSRLFRHRDEASWHHGDAAAARHDLGFARAPEEREIVRRKTFAPRPESLEDALSDLESLDHDFFLFVDDRTGADALVARVDGGYSVSSTAPVEHHVAAVKTMVAARPATMTLSDAVARLDAGNDRFVFFVDAETGRSAVLYRRYDGHYGFITPAQSVSTDPNREEPS